MQKESSEKHKQGSVEQSFLKKKNPVSSLHTGSAAFLALSCPLPLPDPGQLLHKGMNIIDDVI